MTTAERLDFYRLNAFIAEQRLIRGEWVGTDDEGRETACLLAALYPPVGKARSETACPAALMPPWLASLTVWIDDSGSLEKWPGHVKRYAAVIGSVVALAPDAMERLSRKIRVLIVREAVSRITVDEWGCRAACDGVVAALESGDAKAISAARSAAESAAWSAAWSAAESAAGSAAESAARSAAESAAWSAAESAAWSAAESAAGSAAESAARSAAESAAWSAAESAAWSAAWSAAESAARSAAESAARSAAESAAGSAAESAAGSAAGSAAEDRMIDAMLTAMEAAAIPEGTPTATGETRCEFYWPNHLQCVARVRGRFCAEHASRAPEGPLPRLHPSRHYTGERMSTTWTKELEQAATRAEIQAQETDERTAGVRWQYLRGIHEAEARCLRQRAAWVRETLDRINRATPTPQNRAVNNWLNALTGPIPSPGTCAGCLPADGDYGDGPPPMVLGRHVEGCNGTATTERKET